MQASHTLPTELKWLSGIEQTDHLCGSGVDRYGDCRLGARWRYAPHAGWGKPWYMYLNSVDACFDTVGSRMLVTIGDTSATNGLKVPFGPVT